MLNKKDKIILITGATGHQGSAVTNSLLAHGWSVRALVRDLSKPSAILLRSEGADIVKGDLDDPKTLDSALQGVYGVFAVHAWMEKGVESEVRMGRNLADAALAAGIKHYVYSSAIGADGGTGVPAIDSKCRIEQYILKAHLPSTIFRPTFFMFNFNRSDIFASIRQGTLSLPLKPDLPLQMLAVEDLSEFVNLAFERPAFYIGKVMELAGDELTMLEAAEVFSKVIGRRVSYVEQPLEKARIMNEGRAMILEWLNTHKINTDIMALRFQHRRLLTLETWLGRSPVWAKAA
jgi:uncharacterized protein YbjT (DUF2867 family)